MKYWNRLHRLCSIHIHEDCNLLEKESFYLSSYVLGAVLFCAVALLALLLFCFVVLGGTKISIFRIVYKSSFFQTFSLKNRSFFFEFVKSRPQPSGSKENKKSKPHAQIKFDSLIPHLLMLFQQSRDLC